MYQKSLRTKQNAYPSFPRDMATFAPMAAVTCDWSALRQQLLLQWKRLNATELDNTGADRIKIAKLVERKYGIASKFIENYLRNFERTLPVPASAY